MAGADRERNPLRVVFGRYGESHRHLLAGGLLARGLSRIPDQLPNLLIGIAIDAVFLQDTPYRLPLVPAAWIPQGRVDQFLLTLAVVAATFPAAAALNYASSRWLGTYGAELQHDVRTRAFDTVQRLEMRYFDDRDTGDVMSVLNDDVGQLNAFIFGVLQRVVAFGAGLVVAFAILLWLNWQLAVTLLVVPAILGAISYWFSSVMEPKHLAIRERVGELNSRLDNNVGGIRVIKSFNTESYEADRVRTASGRHKVAQWDAHKVRSGTEPVMRIVCNTTGSITLLLGGYWVLFGPPLFYSGTLTPGALYTFLSFVWAFVTPMEQLVSAIDSYQEGKAAATRLVEATDDDRLERTGEDGAGGDGDDGGAPLGGDGVGGGTPLGGDAPPGGDGAGVGGDAGVPLGSVEGAVEYEDVTFTYAGRDEPAIADVSLAADPGETIGVVGPTGAGKSTLLKLLFRFYEPDSGSITIDGRDVAGVPLRDLREAIGYVSQDPFLFHGTVRENVAYADPDADDAAVEEATRLAGAHEFVEGLPEGYDTVVGDRGVKLSGGQRQRIAIARAIYRDPAILVFDEATSHVDNETEALIQHAMDAVAADRTTFVIAHRLSTVRDADRILVMDDGAIAERGTHADLLDADGLYADLWRIQVGEVEALPDEFLERVRRGDAAEGDAIGDGGVDDDAAGDDAPRGDAA